MIHMQNKTDSRYICFGVFVMQNKVAYIKHISYYRINSAKKWFFNMIFADW